MLAAIFWFAYMFCIGYFALRLLREPDADKRRLMILLAAVAVVTYMAYRLATR